MDPAELRAFFAEHFPAATEGLEILALGDDGAEVVFETGARHLRPGGTVSGPVLMTLADTATYAALLARLGPAVAQGVTSSLEMHFLHRPGPGRLAARCRLLKVGRRLAVASVEIEGGGVLVAFATVTYALPG